MPPICWCCRPGSRRTAWSSSRRWLAASQQSSPLAPARLRRSRKGRPSTALRHPVHPSQPVTRQAWQRCYAGGSPNRCCGALGGRRRWPDEIPCPGGSRRHRRCSPTCIACTTRRRPSLARRPRRRRHLRPCRHPRHPPPELINYLIDSCGLGGVLEIIDLGAGTGANQRWLAPRLPFVQRWIHLDHDPAISRSLPLPDDTMIIDGNVDRRSGGSWPTARAIDTLSPARPCSMC